VAVTPPRRLSPGRPAADNRTAKTPPTTTAGKAGCDQNPPHAVAAKLSGTVGMPAKGILFVAFAFAIMADPVSSVAYTIEASLRAQHGYLGLLMATQIIVLGIILLVDVSYWQLVGRFPMGGGSAEGAARAFGTG
jgi:hypothetical protein